MKEWESKEGVPLAEAKVVRIYGGIAAEGKRQFITKLDNGLNSLKECEQLSLSTNQIDRLIPFGGMKKLKILSLGRNQIKKIEKLEDLSDTLEELWLSYNSIATLDGLAPLRKLQVLYLSNNKIKDWGELEKLQANTELRDVLFVGNPIYEGLDRAEAKLQVLKRIPHVMKVDGDIVKDSEREAAQKM